MVLAIARVILLSEQSKSDSDYSSEKNTTDNLDDANNIIISLVFLAYGILFVYYGTTLNCRIRKSSRTKMAGLWKNHVFSIGLCLCFIVRCVLFSYRILDGGKKMNNNVFIFFNYYVPEIVPALLILWTVNTKMFRDPNASSNGSVQEDDDFVDPLIAEAEDDDARL